MALIMSLIAIILLCTIYHTPLLLIRLTTFTTITETFKSCCTLYMRLNEQQLLLCHVNTTIHSGNRTRFSYLCRTIQSSYYRIAEEMYNFFGVIDTTEWGLYCNTINSLQIQYLEIKYLPNFLI